MPPDTKTPNNSEIDQALKEFEAKSAPSEAQQTPNVSKIPPIPPKEVAGVSFETDSYKAIKFYKETDTPKMVKLVMKLSGGAIKEQRLAEYVLFGIVVLMFVASFYFFFVFK